MDVLSVLESAKEKAERLKTILNKDDVEALDKLIGTESWDPKGFFFATSSYPLDWAAAAGAVTCLERLMTLRNQQPGAAEQALVEAVRESQVACVRLLLGAGVAAEGVPGQYVDDTEDDSPVSAALDSLHPEVVSMVCESGGIARSETEWLNVGLRMAFSSRKKAKNQCLLMVAAEIGKRIEAESEFTLAPEVMKKLADWLKKTARKVKDEETGHLEEVVRGRFRAEEGLRQELLGFLTSSACLGTHKELLKLRQVFLELKPAPRQRLASAALPHLVSVASDHHNWWSIVFEALEEWAADINATCGGGKTSLMWAFTTSKPIDSIEIQGLLSFKPDVNAVDDEGCTALTELCCRHPDRADLFELLRSHGAKTFEELGIPYPRYLESYLKEQFAKLPPLPEETVVP